MVTLCFFYVENDKCLWLMYMIVNIFFSMLPFSLFCSSVGVRKGKDNGKVMVMVRIMVMVMVMVMVIENMVTFFLLDSFVLFSLQ